MEQIVFIVEKTSTGFSAYAEDFEKIPAGTTGDTIAELKANIEDAYNSVAEDKGWPDVSIKNITVKYDLAQLFDYFGINASYFSQRIDIDQSQLIAYLSNIETPTDRDIKNIIRGLQGLGKELSSLDI